MKKKSPLLGALPIIAQALGRGLGVNVVIGGSQACTNGRTVYLPELPAEGESLAVLANGFIDHEAAHIRYTDFTVQKPQGLAVSWSVCWKISASNRRSARITPAAAQLGGAGGVS